MPRLLPPLTLAAIALAFVLGAALEENGVELGTPRPPFLFDVDPLIAPGWALLAVVVLAGAVWLAPRLLALPPAGFAAATFALALAARLAVGSMREGPEGMDAVFEESFEAVNEYPAAFPALRYGAGFLLDRFAELVPALPVHAGGHPPGLLLTLDALGLRAPGEVTAFVVLVGTLAVPLTYAIARRVLDERRARLAGLLAALSSGMTLYGATAPDIVFAALGAGACALLLASRRVAATAGAVALALASFFSYALLAIGAFAVFVRLRTDSLRGAIVVGAACGAALVVGYALLYAATGFSLIEVVARTEELYRNSVASERPYLYWLLGSPAAFLTFLGLPITWYLARAVGAGRTVALALAVVILISAVGGFTKAETERIWLMYAPLACVGAAAVLPERRLVLVLGLLAAQTLLVEVVFGTVW